MAQAKKAESDNKDIIEFMNSVLNDLEKMQGLIDSLSKTNKATQDEIAELSARLQTIESIPLLASHIRTQNASASN